MGNNGSTTRQQQQQQQHQHQQHPYSRHPLYRNSSTTINNHARSVPSSTFNDPISNPSLSINRNQRPPTLFHTSSSSATSTSSHTPSSTAHRSLRTPLSAPLTQRSSTSTHPQTHTSQSLPRTTPLLVYDSIQPPNQKKESTSTSATSPSTLLTHASTNGTSTSTSTTTPLSWNSICLSIVDQGHVVPQNDMYATTSPTYDPQIVAQLILQRHLAPFYLGLEDIDEYDIHATLRLHSSSSTMKDEEKKEQDIKEEEKEVHTSQESSLDLVSSLMETFTTHTDFTPLSIVNDRDQFAAPLTSASTSSFLSTSTTTSSESRDSIQTIQPLSISSAFPTTTPAPLPLATSTTTTTTPLNVNPNENQNVNLSIKSPKLTSLTPTSTSTSTPPGSIVYSSTPSAIDLLKQWIGHVGGAIECPICFLVCIFLQRTCFSLFYANVYFLTFHLTPFFFFFFFF
ncbi:hypothetical protein HMI55_007370 [Coelomomyces lativittatus]|nr:hypothetical protein HMI55_007370 [Coelomomyces lativittatus]